MLSPFPKSTTISPGTPRKACITRRCRLSVTSEFLEQLADGLGPIHIVLLQDFRQTLGEIRWQILHRVEEGQEELLCARTVHQLLLAPEALAS
jgi:hypothetical protein